MKKKIVGIFLILAIVASLCACGGGGSSTGGGAAQGSAGDAGQAAAPATGKAENVTLTKSFYTGEKISVTLAVPAGASFVAWDDATDEQKSVYSGQRKETLLFVGDDYEMLFENHSLAGDFKQDAYTFDDFVTWLNSDESSYKDDKGTFEELKISGMDAYGLYAELPNTQFYYVDMMPIFPESNGNLILSIVVKPKDKSVSAADIVKRDDFKQVLDSVKIEAAK